MLTLKAFALKWVELSDDGATKTYSYEYGATVASEYMDDLYWDDISDGQNTLKIQSVHMFNELESGLGGGFASWHMYVVPFYMPEECEGEAVEDQADCAYDNMEVSDHWYLYDATSGLFDVRWDTLFPGPYATGDICEWAAIEDLGRNQLVEYNNYIIWDWDDLCYFEGTSEYEDLCDPYSDETGDECFEARGCADGVIVYLYESDEGWYDDFGGSFVVVEGEQGEVFRSRSGYIDITFYNDNDTDGDGLTDNTETEIGSDPENADTDGDGLTDGEEVLTYATSPINTDTDGEGLSDGEEVLTYHTDPNNTDTDGDEINDKQEIDNGFDPNDETDALEDADSDSLTNKDEILTYETDPNNADTDGDTLDDGYEVLTFGSNPLSTDTDGDSLNDDKEKLQGTSPTNTDSDSDGLDDGDEVYTHLTDPTNADSDYDNLSDGDEVNTYGTNPNNDDTDNDDLNDDKEIRDYGTDPKLADTDGDGLDDGDEIFDYSTSPTNADTDGEGLSDGEEVKTHHTDPLDTDTDNDQWNDYEEVHAAFQKDPLKFDNLVETTRHHDFVGNGFGDLIAFYPTGTFSIITSNGHSLIDLGSWITGFGDASSAPLSGDFNGDKKTDLGIFQPSTGEIKIALSDGTRFADDGVWISGFSQNGNTALTGDFDGDGKDDILIKTNLGSWNVALNQGSSFTDAGTWLNLFSINNKKYFVEDFNADGKDDLLVFHKNTGDIYVALSNGTSFDTPTKWLINFGITSPFTFVGEFDGNGQADFLAYQNNGTFEVATSFGTAFNNLGIRGNGFSRNPSQVAAGDFNGDCLIDAVGITSEGLTPSWSTSSWVVFTSNGNYLTNQGSWAISEDSSSTARGCLGSENTNLPFYNKKVIKIEGLTLTKDKAWEHPIVQ